MEKKTFTHALNFILLKIVRALVGWKQTSYGA